MDNSKERAKQRTHCCAGSPSHTLLRNGWLYRCADHETKKDSDES